MPHYYKNAGSHRHRRKISSLVGLVLPRLRPPPLPANQPLSSQQERVDSGLRMMSETTSPCDGDDSVSTGTMFFARSNDSLVMPRELVLSDETIDVDHFDADHNTQRHKLDDEDRPADQHHPSSSGPKASGSAPKSGGNKSTLVTNLTARLTRPKKPHLLTRVAQRRPRGAASLSAKSTIAKQSSAMTMLVGFGVYSVPVSHPYKTIQWIGCIWRLKYQRGYFYARTAV